MVFLVFLARGISHLLTNTQNTQPREWKKRSNHGLGWTPSVKREKPEILLCILCFCGLTRVCTRAKLPQATSNADCLGQPGISRSTGLSRRLSEFYWLVTSLFCSHLLTDLLLAALSCWLSQGTSFPCPLPVTREISRVVPLCGICAKTDKRILWLAPTNIVSQAYKPSLFDSKAIVFRKTTVIIFNPWLGG